ncbi:response regulator transcription factor [Dyadobacter sp. CY356]|uniref:response regulator n=1 Tax=Dyadobacter sp. CY356 TaxID=2906442 RepID=UPI001F285251|nr:response regulator transcription factor [Dyadobacter sp. CY356]MCF0055206.1 response regulator transcription factor [Dyadobacter sp. CY356]
MNKILIVDDHRMTCLGIQIQVEKVIKAPRVHIADSFTEAIRQLEDNYMDLIILDLGIPGGLGTAMIEALRKQQPGARILVCTGRDELLFAPLYLAAGVNGFLHKASSDQQTQSAILTVMEDRQYVSGLVQQKMFKDILNGNPQKNPLESLSVREKQVLALLLAGKWTKEIADELNLKFSTVSTQKTRIFQKLAVENIVDLVRIVDRYQP